ncbi:MAG TPA: lytic transglycosylase domain-containing protein [Symbiobacteriaceae bacterium]|nr:lytic transglycosylase domain-containing protein [Symbiobacteriaceae bacterium]
MGFRLWPRGVLLILGLLIVAAGALWWAVQRFYPYPYHDLIEAAAARHQVDPHLVVALMRNESHFNPAAQSREGALGLMQIMPETGAWIAAQMEELSEPDKPFDPAQLLDPATNIEMGCWYLANLNREFASDPVVVLAAYNGGRSNVRDWLDSQTWTGERHTLDQIPFPETRIYIGRVLRDQQIYRRLYQRE